MIFAVDLSHLSGDVFVPAIIALAFVLWAMNTLRLRKWKTCNNVNRPLQHKQAVTVAKPPSTTEYCSILPPSQRATIFPDGGTSGMPLGNQKVLEMERNYKLAEPWTCVYSGFLVAEILSLGDFPDYAKLSGVPLPSPIPNFNINKAVPRPYRPLRWVYHQTMGTFQIL